MPNVLLITIDSLRFDRLGCYGYGENTSPNIDALAAKGTLFTETISNGGNTPYSFPTMLASALPPLDVDECKVIMQRHTSLAELLHGAGYRTAAFQCNPFLSRFYGYDKGFDVFQENMRPISLENIRHQFRVHMFSKPPRKALFNFLAKLDKYLESFSFAIRGRPIVAAQQISKQAVLWLKSHNDSFFLWLHYMDVHNPYLPPQRYVRQFHGQRINRYAMYHLWQRMLARPPQLSAYEVETLKNLYDAEINYVDDAIGWLLDKAGRRLENTIIIVTADHGEEFGEHGKFSHQTLYNGVIRVPLIITGPGVEAGGIVREQASLIDLAPTIAELVGLDKVNTFHGESLLPLMMQEEGGAKGVVSTWSDPQPPQRLFAYRTSEWKYISTRSVTTPEVTLAEEVYNLKDDPGETVNLASLQTDEVRRFKLEATNTLLQLKKAKLELITTLERERIKKKVKKLSKP
jgi:arylsulfatase A-like enzyme